MTFQIQIDNNQSDDFLKIIESLKNLYLVKSIKETRNLTSDGEVLKEKDLLTILREREEEIDQGNFLSQEELVKFMKL